MHSNKKAQMIFYVWYNALFLPAFFVLWPLFIYWLLTKPKRRYTFRPRMGWCRYPWQRAEGEPGSKRKRMWVHALSVGEVQAAQPLVDRLHKLHADTRICFSTSTYTGFQTAGRLFGHLHRVDLAYFPYDWIWAVRNVASKIDPILVILTETDIWPNFLMEMRRRHVPVYLINLRLSEKSWKGFKRFWWFSRDLFGALEKIGIQNPSDFMRLQQLGVPPQKMVVTGNIKFDGILTESEYRLAEMWKKRLNIDPGKPIIVAGSTHEGEEKILIQARQALSKDGHMPVLILAPRDPSRSQDLIRLCQDQGLTCGLLSVPSMEPKPAGCCDVVLVDSIGALKALYGLADIVFVGGSLVPCGGHNPLEPAAWGKPILFGPDMRDFPLISELLLDAKGACRVTGSEDLSTVLKGFLSDPASAAETGHRALKVVHAHHGAVDRTLKFLGL